MEDIPNGVFSSFFTLSLIFKEKRMDNEKNESFANKMGRFMGNTLVACIAICLSACMIALTMRFVMWLF